MSPDSNDTPDSEFSVEVNPQGVRPKGLPREQLETAEPWLEAMSGDLATPAPEPYVPAESSPQAPNFWQMALSATRSMAKFVASGLARVDEATQRARLAQCATCNQYDAPRCKLCGCFADKKAWLVHEDCPLGKWPV
jgi:hypothetical protein